MNANVAKVQSLIENTFKAAIDKLVSDEAGNIVTDLYVQVDPESGELQVFDDEEHSLSKVVIFDWVNNQDEESVFNKRVAATIKAVLTVLASKKVFDAPRFMKPFSVSLTDEDFVVLEELLFIDDDMLRLDDPLLKDLDTDLNEFLADLLGDIK